MRRPLLAAAVAALVLGFGAAASVLAPTSARAGGESVFGGLGTWISIYGTRAYQSPDAVAAAVAARGVKTAYLETSNYRQAVDVVRPKQLGRLVDALHVRGVHVVAWYLPGFVEPALDERRALAAIGFRTEGGVSFDGFALDIESTAVRNAAVRTQRALALSRRLRDAVGPAYQLGAIVPSPRGMEIKPAYWPGFPFTQLAATYDAFLPMVYWTYSVRGPDAAYGYLARALAILRSAAGRDEPIHLVGGTSYTASPDEQRAFAQLVRDDGALAGWSLYDWFGTKPPVWQALASIG